jgi:hypothetical protein
MREASTQIKLLKNSTDYSNSLNRSALKRQAERLQSRLKVHEDAEGVISYNLHRTNEPLSYDRPLRDFSDSSGNKGFVNGANLISQDDLSDIVAL